MKFPSLTLVAMILSDLVGIGLICGVFLIPQLVGYFLYRWGSRRRLSHARLIGVYAPPLTLLVPYFVYTAAGRLSAPEAVGPDLCGYDPLSPLIGILAGIHLGAALCAHGVGSQLEPSIDEVPVTPDLGARRPN